MITHGAQGLDSDPTIEAYKRHVDRSLLIENLWRTPEDRLAAMVSMLELISALRGAVCDATGTKDR